MSNGALVAGDAGNMIEAAFGSGQDLAMLGGKAAAETIIERLESGDFSAEVLSVYKDKLNESQKAIYDGYNIARQFLFTDPKDLNDYVKLYKERAKSGALSFNSSLPEWIALKMQTTHE